MDNWIDEITGTYIDLISGFAFKSKNFLSEKTDDSLPVIKIKNVANGDVNLNNIVYHNVDDSLKKFIISKGDLLIAMTGNHPQADSQVVGDVSRYKLDSKSLLNQRVGKIIPKENTDLDFIYYLFKNKDTHTYLANQSSGSANQANISKSNILNLELSFPSFKEQKAIGQVLKSLDDKIDLLYRQNKTLENLAETLFKNWFSSYETKKHKLHRFEDIVEHIKPGTNYQPKRIAEGIPFLNVRNLDNGFIDGSQFRYISEEEYKRVHKNWQPEENDILISRIGTLGLVAIIKKSDLPIAVHYNMLNIKASFVSYSFLYFLLKSDFFQTEYDTVKRVSVQEYVAVDDAKNIEIPLPISEDLISFEEQTNSFMQRIVSYQWVDGKHLSARRIIDNISLTNNWQIVGAQLKRTT